MNTTDRPGIAPCHTAGTKPNACAVAVHNLKNYGLSELGGPWKGWRLAGRNLVTPDGLRISPERVRGLAWRQDAEARLDAAKARNARKDKQLVRVVVVTLTEFQQHRAGAS